MFFAKDPVYARDRKTDLHDGVEPYVKLGRLCVVKEERGRRVADSLIQGALDWARENWEEVRKMDENEGGEWKGLVCVHAQEGAVKTWARNGFVADERMGTWLEAQIRHVGMWRRVEFDDST